MRTISFNAAATAAIHGRKGAKLRLDVKDNTLFMRPTDRKAGPHVLSELATKGKSGVQIQITDKELEKLGATEVLAVDSKFGLVADKYGWFALRTDVSADDKMAVEGAEATVGEIAEPAAADA